MGVSVNWPCEKLYSQDAGEDVEGELTRLNQMFKKEHQMLRKSACLWLNAHLCSHVASFRVRRINISLQNYLKVAKTGRTESIMSQVDRNKENLAAIWTKYF